MVFCQLFCIDGHFWADNATELTVRAGLFFSITYNRIVVAFGVDVFGFHKNLLWAELNAEFAALAAVGDNKNSALRRCYCVNV